MVEDWFDGSDGVPEHDTDQVVSGRIVCCIRDPGCMIACILYDIMCNLLSSGDMSQVVEQEAEQDSQTDPHD